MSDRWASQFGNVFQDGVVRAECHGGPRYYDKGPSTEKLAHDIAARLNGPSPAEVAALLRTIEWSGGDNCGERVCPDCFATKHPGGDHAKAKHEPDCELAAMIKQCEGA